MINKQNVKKENITKLAGQCYERLENAISLTKLILGNSAINKENEIALNMVLSDIKSTIEIILEIQDSV